MNPDRGTPFVCNNAVSGILSVVLPADNTFYNASSCVNTRKTLAYYTPVFQQYAWINQQIPNLQQVAATVNTYSPAYNGKCLHVKSFFIFNYYNIFLCIVPYNPNAPNAPYVPNQPIQPNQQNHPNGQTPQPAHTGQHHPVAGHTTPHPKKSSASALSDTVACITAILSLFLVKVFV